MSKQTTGLSIHHPKESCARRLVLGAVLLATLLTAAPSTRAQSTRLTGKVEEVTLFRGQALITRSIDLGDEVGHLQVVVADLPEQVLPGSTFAEADEGCEVRAVRYRARAVSEEPREEVRDLEAQIEALAQKIAANKQRQELASKKLQHLDKLEAFVAASAGSDLAKGALDSNALEKLVLFGFTQRQQAAEEQLAADQAGKQLDKDMALLARRLAELTSGASKTLREAVVFLEKRAPGPAKVRLSYVVNNCGWSPSYNLRTSADLQRVEVEYQALISQLSGEDWSDVRLTLSTATPALSAEGPGLAPFEVALVSDQPEDQVAGQKRELGSATAEYESIRGRWQVAQQQLLNSISQTENVRSAWNINCAANDFQTFELLQGKEVLASLPAGSTAAADGPSLSYALAAPVSLASRADQQMVRIASFELPSRFHHVATPVLSGFVYREAELTNTSEHDLLGGTVSAYLAGRFVGKAEIGTVARGQTFVVGFGADPQLRTRRELIDKSSAVQGGNQVISARYRLVVENFKDAPIAVRLQDRVPHAERDGDLRVTLGQMSDPLSEHPLYLRLERPKGILRWEVEAPAAAGGEDARVVQYAYTVEFDRKFTLASPAAGMDDKLRAEFEQLHRKRTNR